MQLVPPQSIDPNVPAQIPADQLQDFKGFLDVGARYRGRARGRTC